MKKQYKKMAHFAFGISLLFFLLAPSYFTCSKFTDSAIESAGIKLELGNIDLSFKNQNQVPLEIKTITTKNKLISIDVPEVKNTGTLDGKIFYKIELLQTENGDKPVLIKNLIEDKINLVIQINGIEKTINSTEIGTFYSLMKNSEQPLILSPKESVGIRIGFSSNNLENIESYTLKVTFLMTQTNGTVTEPLFHDINEMVYQLNVDQFWNGQDVVEDKSNLGYKYAVELPKAFEFSNKIEYEKWYKIKKWYHVSNNYGILYLDSKDTINSKNWSELVDPGTDMLFYDFISISNKRAKIKFKLNHNVLSSDYKYYGEYNKETKFYLMKNKKTHSINFTYTASNWAISEPSRTTEDVPKSIARTFKENNLVEDDNYSNQQKIQPRGGINTSIPKMENKKVESIEQKEETREPANQPKEIVVPEDDDFKYTKLTFQGKHYNVGIRQKQLSWLLSFKSIQDFSDNLTKTTPALYVKYDKVTGIENIEEFLYEIFREEQLSFNISLKDIPERSMLEINFIK